jgi:hypothetical protein
MLKINKTKISMVTVAMFLSILFLQSGQTKIIHNTHEEIAACAGKIKLTLVREWGGLKPKDEAQAFHEPTDIEVGTDGFIYILDAGNSRIQVFDDTGKFINTIGREGKGPGEFTYPVDLAIDNQNNLAISESMGRVQILDSKGAYKKGFKPTDTFPGELAVNQEGILFLYNGGRSKINAVFLLYDYEGNFAGKVGNPEEEESPYLRSIKNINQFTMDNQDNLCLGYIHRALLEKYTEAGDLIWQASYEVNFKVPEVRLKGRNIETKMVSIGLSVDPADRIYLATLTREKTEEERKIGMKSAMMGRGGSYAQRTMPHDIESPKTDLYQILVFENSGEIFASQKLDIFCNKIKVHGNRLFVIDSYVAAKIYEYKISFE